jgi:hypothetical protein
MLHPEQLLLLDIETVPLQPHYHLLPPRLQDHWNRKYALLDPEGKDPADGFRERAGIYAEFGKIVCIGLAYFHTVNDTLTLRTKTLYGHDERLLLQDFAEVCERFFRNSGRLFAGHNIREFDIPYLCRRALITRVPLPQVLAGLQSRKPWENPMLDTLQYWKFGEYKHFTPVDLLASVLDIESPKGDIDGSDVGRVYWEEGDLERIARYCRRDVVTVGQILLRLNGQDILEATHIFEAES